MSEPVQSVRVEAYAGASYPERPRAVWQQGRRLAVMAFRRSWRTPETLHFLVEVESLGRIELVYSCLTDAWSIMETHHPPHPNEVMP